MKQFLIAGLLALIGTNSYSQYQTKKGHWVLTHTVVSGGPYWYHSKGYEDGVLDDEYSGRTTTINGAFSGPSWAEVDYLREKRPTQKPGVWKERDFSFHIQPQIGYFIKDNFMIGTAFLAGIDSYKQSEDGEFEKFNTYYVGIGPMARYYFPNKKKHRPFVGFESRVYVETGKDHSKYFNNNKIEEVKSNRNAFGARVKPYAGYALFLGKHWTADAHIGFMIDRDDNKKTTYSYTDKVLNNGYPYKERDLYLDKALSLNIGVAYTF